jgi:hypothetical protein
MDSLTTTQGIVALSAAGVGAVALLFAIVLAVKLRRVRTAQRAVLGDGDRRDLVTHAQQLELGFTQLRDWLEESMEHLERRMGELESRVDGCVAYRALVRYDAYNELSGHQSSSLALLDARRSGVVVSSIVHRDQARMYVKQLHEGEPEIDLSPEEQAAVDAALSPAASA